MNKFLIKHKLICSCIFTFLIAEWFLLGNITSLIISKWSIYLDAGSALVALIITSEASSVFLSGCIPDKRLNLYELFLNAALPVMLYYTFKTIDYSNAPMIIFFGTSALLTIAIIYLQKIAKVRKIRIVYYVRHIMAICSIVIIIPSFLFFAFDEKAVYEYYEEVNVDSLQTQDLNAGEEKYIELLTDCKWENLNNEKRSDILYELIKYEASVLGIPAPKLQIVNTQRDQTLGSYDHSSGVILLNNFHLGKNSLEECLSTAMHELYHSYQHSVINILEELPINSRKNSYFNKAVEWQLADNSYAEDHKKFSTYKNNALEVDARNFADEIVEKYLRK